jgi:hypothetical protein
MGAVWLWAAEITLWAWGSEARRIPDWSTRSDFRWSCFHARNCKWFVTDSTLGDKPDGKVLILTDGFWTRDGTLMAGRLTAGHAARHPNRRGCQPASFQGLKGAKVFAAEEVLAVLDNWLQADEEWA